MNRRRFAALTVALVALNLVLWLAPAGLAVRKAVISQFFGPRMVKAEVVVLDASGRPQDYRIDRGVVVAVTPTSITLSEADGTTQTIAVSGTTRIEGPGRGRGKGRGRGRPLTILGLRNMHVLVVTPANGPAQTVDVESRGS